MEAYHNRQRRHRSVKVSKYATSRPTSIEYQKPASNHQRPAPDHQRPTSDHPKPTSDYQKPVSFAGIELRSRGTRAPRGRVIRSPILSGQRFRSLREQNLVQKHYRSERAPNATGLKLQDPGQFAMGEDTALNLPRVVSTKSHTFTEAQNYIQSSQINHSPLQTIVDMPEETPASKVLREEAKDLQQAKHPRPRAPEVLRDEARELLQAKRAHPGASVRDTLKIRFEDIDLGNVVLEKIANVFNKLSADPRKKTLNFEKRDVVTLLMYRSICSGLSNEISGISPLVEPTARIGIGYAAFVAQLKTDDTAVLWSQLDDDFSLILYPAKSPWKFLEQGFPACEPSALRLAIRGSLQRSILPPSKRPEETLAYKAKRDRSSGHRYNRGDN